MEDKTYNIVLNRINATTQSNPFQYIFYFNFDWTIIPDQDYYVYSYIATNSLIYKTGTSQYPYIIVNTNAFQGNTFISDQLIQDKNMTLLGYIYPTTVIGGGLSYAYWATSMGATNNIPNYINGRPTQNNFYIRYLNGDLTSTYPNQEYDLSQFVLTLKFVPVKNVKKIVLNSILAKELTLHKLTNKIKKSYNLVLNSRNSYDNVSNKTCKFYFDWSVLPDNTAFQVYTSSISSFSGGWLGSSYGSFPVFTIDCFPMNNFENSSTIMSRTTTRLCSFVADRNANNVNFPTPYTYTPPIYLRERPRQNDFTIAVYNSWMTNIFGFAIGTWVLNLKFVPI